MSADGPRAQRDIELDLEIREAQARLRRANETVYQAAKAHNAATAAFVEAIEAAADELRQINERREAQLAAIRDAAHLIAVGVVIGFSLVVGVTLSNHVGAVVAGLGGLVLTAMLVELGEGPE